MTELSEQSEIAEKIARLFDSRWLRGYVRSKITRDPVYAAAYERLRHSEHPVLDLGCGLGLLGLYLRERGFEPDVLGIDSDDKKIAAARRAAEGRYTGLSFRTGSALSVEEGFRGHVMLLDLVHYFSDADQTTLLENTIRYRAPGSRVVIRECPRDRSWRYSATYLEEWFATSIGWLRVPMLNFPTKEKIESVFRENGYRAEITPLWTGTPFNNHLFVFEAGENAKPLSPPPRGEGQG